MSLLLLAALLALAAPAAFAKDAKDEVGVEAESVVFDRNTGVITTIGRTRTTYGDNTLDTGAVRFDTGSNELQARGASEIKSPDMTAETRDIRLSTSTLGAMVGETYVRFTKGGEAVAASADMDGPKTTLRGVRYTACKEGLGECANPSWSIRASSLVHDREGGNISYWNPVLFAGRVPVLYLPYMTSATPDVKNRSGLLYPMPGYSNKFGWTWSQPLFWKISPYSDLLLSPTFMDRGGPVYRAEARTNQELFYAAAKGSFKGPDDFALHPQEGWHYTLSGGVNFTDVWNLRLNVDRTNDPRYVRLYESSGQSWLTSGVALGGFWPRSYLVLEEIFYQDIRDYPYTPRIVPMLEWSGISDTNRAGGYLESRLSASRVVRNYYEPGAVDTEYTRTSGILRYHQPMRSPGGHLFDLALSGRGDGYVLRHVITDGQTTEHYSGTQGRWSSQASLKWSYPLLAHGFLGVGVIEPAAQVITGPQVRSNPLIPNLDSNYMELSTLNLFDEDRFSGYDLLESGTRANYGLSMSRNYGREGSMKFFIGQNYNFSVPDDIYFENSGLRNSAGASDVVSSGAFSPFEALKMDYRLRVDKDSMSANSTDVGVTVGGAPLSLTGRYLYLKNIYVDGQSVRLHAVTYGASSRFAPNWRIGYSERYDLDLGRPLIRSATISYDDDCFQVVFAASDNMTKDDLVGGERTYSVLFNFKGLGSVGSNQFMPAGQ